jgi:hypothetical protein
MKKFLAMLFAVTLVVACGKGREAASHEDEGEDDEQPAAAASATSAAPAAAPVVSADAATINGLVKFEGTPAKPPALQMSADPFCQSQHAAPVTDEEVVVGPAGELANVILWIKNAPSAPPPQTAALLDQKGCRYIPHVQAIQVNQPLQIRNDDNTLHNVHAMPSVNSQFNEGQPVQGMVSTKKFDKPEPAPFKVKCDVHGWMKSYMIVLPHPYHGVSAMNGAYTIPNLPPGNYTIVAWHEKFGQQEQNITVAPKEQKQVNFTFKG